MNHQIPNIILIISSVNVFIYCTVGKQFKEIMKKSFRRKRSIKLSPLGSNSEVEKTEVMQLTAIIPPTVMTTYLQLSLK